MGFAKQISLFDADFVIPRRTLVFGAAAALLSGSLNAAIDGLSKLRNVKVKGQFLGGDLNWDFSFLKGTPLEKRFAFSGARLSINDFDYTKSPYHTIKFSPETIIQDPSYNIDCLFRSDGKGDAISL